MKNVDFENLCQDAAFQAVFMQYGESIRNFIYSKCGDLALAEDITQDTFVTLWQKCVDADHLTVKSFLYKIAGNKVIDHFRHQKVKMNYRTEKRSMVDHITPQFELEKKEFKDYLESVLAMIPEASRTVFIMSRIEKLKYAEIADRLDVSVKAVEKRMHKALLIIKKQLGRKL
ncbi:MAG TPA: RNA polymerase sigma-70 factor [Saprospiraceae bacterium]|nr:RNA polymerase sigma-70 factor [Saprospiraceae bacterium]